MLFKKSCFTFLWICALSGTAYAAQSALGTVLTGSDLLHAGFAAAFLALPDVLSLFSRDKQTQPDH